ncbi:uncharacterized protein LOC106876446 isoform X2 [Octopus bimaculoides]|uniref:Uncharacterized protein n=1 Tax=Octopus bimaculoides TaxID=37653 RepID=A0A0L8GKS3_OCTBM|nr:uncharacterized protein LOC106876446 isoform X2 [Octopus bimaculoides]|eukprot:XP_014780487.1 PREDICTED: uncharacterized protein LOC106876446 isoform X2 [Octopus bimaculoides]
MDTAQYSTIDSGKVVSTAPEPNETEENSDSMWDVDAEVIIIWVTGVIVLITLLTMLICFLATRRKQERTEDSPIRTRSRNEEAVNPGRSGIGISCATGDGVGGVGGENPAYTRNSDELNGLFNIYHPRMVNSLPHMHSPVSNQGGQQWNSSSQTQAANLPDADGGFQQISLPPSHITEASPSYYPGPPPPSPPPLLLTRSNANVSSRDYMRNEDYVLDPYFLASAPPPYTRYAEDYHPTSPADASCSLPVRNERSYRVAYDYF